MEKKITTITHYECSNCKKVGKFNSEKLLKYARCQNCGSEQIVPTGADTIRLLKLISPSDVIENASNQD